MAFLVFLYWITLIASLISIVCPSQTFKQSDISSSKLADHDNLNSITIDNELKGSEFTIHYVSWLFHPNQPYSIPTTSPSQSSIPLNIISHVDDDPYQIVQLPFSFNFLGINHDYVYVGANGVLAFDTVS